MRGLYGHSRVAGNTYRPESPESGEASRRGRPSHRPAGLKCRASAAFSTSPGTPSRRTRRRFASRRRTSQTRTDGYSRQGRDGRVAPGHTTVRHDSARASGSTTLRASATRSSTPATGRRPAGRRASTCGTICSAASRRSSVSLPIPGFPRRWTRSTLLVRSRPGSRQRAARRVVIQRAGQV